MLPAFLHAALVALLVTVVPTVVNLIGSSNRIATFLGGVASIVVITVIYTMYFFFEQPVIGLNATSYYQSWLGWTFGLLIATVITSATSYDWDGNDITLGNALAVCVFAAFLIIGGIQHVMWSQGEAQQLLQTVSVTQEKVGAYPDSDAAHIVVVPEEVALSTAKNAMTSQGTSLSTIFELYDPTLQVVDEHTVWIVPMRPRGIGENSSVNGIAPGYIVVDAENPDTPARIQEKDADGNQLAIKYLYQGYANTDLSRYTWSNGYAGTPLDDWTLEVNDKWQPFWTVTTNRTTLRFDETVPDGLLVVNAQTGEIQHYGLDKIPSWIDRVYSANTVKAMLGWWGDLQGNNFGLFDIGRNAAGRYKLADNEEPTLVYTKEGYPAWQIELTSQNPSDNAVSFVALFEGRTNHVRLYQVPDAQTETGIVSAVASSNNNTQKIEPQHLAIHKIYSRLTWVGTLARDGNMQGITLVPADAKPNAGNVVIAPTMSQALNAYRTVISGNGNAKPGESSNLTQLTGVVSRVSSPITEAGKTVYYFTLQGETNLYRVVFDPLANNSQLEVPFIKVGAHVTVKFNDAGETRRDVVLYDDLGLSLTK